MKPKNFLYLGLLIAALIVAACGPQASPEPTATPTSLPTDTPAPTATPTPPPPTDTPAPTATSTLAPTAMPAAMAEVPMGFTKDGQPYRGDPDAPVTLVEYSDFQCPYCGRHTLQTGPLLYKTYIVTGKVKHVFIQFPLESIHPQAKQAAEASLCAAKQGAKAFWAMHDRLFETRSQWSGKNDLTERFTEYASELGLDTDAFTTCLESEETADQVQADLKLGEEAGVTGVPAFQINDWFISGAQPFEVFQEVIEAALRGEHPPPTPTPLPPGVTVFDPNPDQPGYTYGGDAFCGSEEAKFGLIEFVDFQSKENREHFLKVWPELKRKYVDSGQVRLIVKHFPSSDQAPGFKAAQAAECAGQQGAFCAMFDLLFQRQEEWSQASDLSATLKGYAAELGLDAEAFAACLDKGQTKDKVKRDLAIAKQNNFPPAPQFFFIIGQRGGYVPLDQLSETIEKFLTR